MPFEASGVSRREVGPNDGQPLKGIEICAGIAQLVERQPSKL